MKVSFYVKKKQIQGRTNKPIAGNDLNIICICTDSALDKLFPPGTIWVTF